MNTPTLSLEHEEMRTRSARRENAKAPRLTWVLRSLLDYRVPVFAALDACVDHQLHVIFSTCWSPERVQQKLAAALGPRAIALAGGGVVGTAKPQEANTSICIPFQPGLHRAIVNTRPDVLIGDGFFQWTRYALRHRVTRQTPLVVCYERTEHTERSAQWYRKLYRRIIIKLVDACCVNGQQSLAYTQSLGMPASRVTTGFMAADTALLAKQCEAISGAERQDMRAQWRAQGLVFLFVGQLIKRKGAQPLLQAWARFERALPGAGTLVIIGSGPEEAALKQQAEALGLKAARFAGPVDYDRIAPRYAAADVFILPTLEDNWSLVVPEAMACGLPVLTSQYNGCWPELVHTDDNGWVFDALEPEDICRALTLCVKRKADLPRMGKRSKEIVSHYNPEHAAASILQACDIALANRSRS